VLLVLVSMSWFEQQANINCFGKLAKPAAETLLRPHAAYRDDAFKKNHCVRLLQPI
jgi:hypothetical protein